VNFALLLPLGLAALAAWLVPLLIHLRRRSEQQRTAFAALRWLPARARPRSRLRFEEWPLLLVRLLLLAALALLLASPVLYGGPQSKRWVVVAPGIDMSAVTKRDNATEYRWLAPGFPTLATPAPATRQPVGSLLRELDATLPARTAVTVLVPAVLDGADAVRPVLHRSVHWQVVEGESKASAPAPQATPRPLLAVRHAEESTEALRYLRATAIAWQMATAPSDDARESEAPARDIAPLTQPLPAIDRPLAWLAPGPLPTHLRAWIDKGGTALVDAATEVPDMQRDGAPLWRDEAGDVLVRGVTLGNGRVLQWTRPLTPEAIPVLLDPTFPERLWSLLAPAATPPARIAAADYAPSAGARTWPEIPRDLQPWLLLLIAILFVIERWIANGRREVASE
jgi:hypothetical protein